MSKQIAVIVEGNRREQGYWSSVEKSFFPKTRFSIVPLSAGENLYMLWKQLQEDDFNTDIIELVREYSPTARAALKDYTRDDFQEVYLFFDYDPHQTNLTFHDKNADSVLLEMLQAFDNETENGKLYISYPMCEALRDVNENSCLAYSACLFSANEISKYKELSSSLRYSNPIRYDLGVWNMFTAIFIKRVSCLFEQDNEKSHKVTWIKTFVTPAEIYKRESCLYNNLRLIFILSAFPEFLIDYFPSEHLSALLETIPFIDDIGCSQKGLLSLHTEI